MTNIVKQLDLSISQLVTIFPFLIHFSVGQTPSTVIYYVTIRTGDISDAGTDATVSLTLVGSDGRSVTFHPDSPQDDFERNTEKEYRVSSHYLGSDVGTKIASIYSICKQAIV